VKDFPRREGSAWKGIGDALSPRRGENGDGANGRDGGHRRQGGNLDNSHTKQRVCPLLLPEGLFLLRSSIDG